MFDRIPGTSVPWICFWQNGSCDVMSLCENLREHGYGFDLTLFFKPRPFRATTVLPGIWAHGKSLDL